MKTQPRKLYFGILVVGLCALAVDRLILSEGPSAAAAAIAEAGGEEQSDPISDVVGKTEALFSEAASESGSLAKRLCSAAPAEGEVGDVFRYPDDWLGGGEAVVIEATDRSDPPAEEARVDGMPALEVSSVMARPDGTGVAVVNGVPVRAGQSIGGFVLERVDQKAAVFSGPSGVFELRVTIPGLSNQRNPTPAGGR